MALSSTFEANFDQFVAESKKAEAALAGIAVSATTTTTATAKLGTASNNTFTTMAGQLRTADQSMQALGVSINPIVNVMTELGQVAGKSASELGALGTVSAVTAAAMAGWNIGRWIADLTGADEAIASFTARLFGLGDVAGEIAGNNLDLMNRAIGKGFTGAVDDFVGASAFLQKAAHDNADALNKAAKDSAAAFDQMARDSAAAYDQAIAKAEQAAQAQRALRDSLFGTDQVAKANAAIAAIGGIAGVSRMATDAQAALHTTIGLAIASLEREGKMGTDAMNAIYAATLPLPPITTGLGAEWTRVGETVKVNADAIIADLQRMADETKAYEAETQRLVDEWNQVKPPVDATTGAIDGTTAAVGRLTVQMQDLGRVNQTAWEALAAGQALMDAYRQAGVATGAQIGLGGYNFAQQLATGVMPTSTASGQNTLNVNVNNADAQGIASKLVTEMRHQGIRF